MEVKVFHRYEDFCLEKFENTDEWYYGIYPFPLQGFYLLVAL